MDKIENINFSLYEFDENKGIYSKYWKKWCEGSPNKNGYIIVWLKDNNGNKHSYAYHRVMCYVFNKRPKELENIPFEKLDVNHKNENRADFRASNLEWITTGDNINYGNGNKRRSETNKKIVHSPEWNRRVAEALSKPVIQVKDDGTIVEWKNIAECNANGFIQSAVSQCCNNKFHSEKKVKSHRRYKKSEWYFANEYEKRLEN